ncbi:aldolase [Cedecea neteri]|uniref:3-oxo-tetronate 4-phosphate decarboxylase n=1 Tax=Cedecea neteri TaxID=158822 RepID=UPI00289313B8|nr:aldolase [Cedecea neteri]WNJ78027.1 aldolase [Cedecea neteri]
MFDENALRNEICEVGASLFRRGYTVGSSGNISARLDDGFLITPGDCSLGALTPAVLAKVDCKGEWIEGARPSKTLHLHRSIYQENLDVKGIIHTHSTHLVLLTLNGVWDSEAILPPITPYQVMKIGRIPLIAYRRPGSPLVIEQVKAIAAQVNGVMLERLGPVVWGQSVRKAAESLEELEETAKLWNLAQRKPEPLTAIALSELTEAFNCVW